MIPPQPPAIHFLWSNCGNRHSLPPQCPVIHNSPSRATTVTEFLHRAETPPSVPALHPSESYRRAIQRPALRRSAANSSVLVRPDIDRPALDHPIVDHPGPRPSIARTPPDPA